MAFGEAFRSWGSAPRIGLTLFKELDGQSLLFNLVFFCGILLLYMSGIVRNRFLENIPFFFLIQSRVLLCSQVWPWTHHSLAFTFWMIRLQPCANMLDQHFKNKLSCCCFWFSSTNVLRYTPEVQLWYHTVIPF